VLSGEERAELGTAAEVVGRWRKRFFEQRLAGIEDRERAGRPRRFSPEQIKASRSCGSRALQELRSVYGITTSFPTKLLRWKSACARASSASGYVAQTSGRSRPDSMCPTRAANSSRLAIVEPSSSNCLR